MTPGPAAVPRRAATLILGRPCLRLEGPSFEILLVKRHGKSGFMAGAHVFPGGRVDDEDEGAAAALVGSVVDSLVDGLDGNALPPLQAATYLVAAVRETREEAGIDVDPRALAPWSWWITPAEEPKRFDTRFFITEVSSQATATIDDHEAVAFVWLTASEALVAYAKGELVLAPPTMATLEDLAPFRSVDDAVRSVKRPLKPICPKILTDDDGMVLALPGDPLHDVKDRVFPHRSRIVMTATGRFESRLA